MNEFGPSDALTGTQGVQTMAKYRVWCEDCEYEKVFDDDNPPRSAIPSWNASEAATDRRDEHALASVDQETDERHTVHKDVVADEEQ